MSAPPVCFLRGTCVRTPQGEVAIENLRIGDLVETVRGEVLPIRWIGRQVFKKSSEHWLSSVLPVRITQGALADGVPQRDLYVSPGHRLYLDRCLIEAQSLINGRSIAQALPDGTDEIHYFHLELDEHEMILAEGAPAETFQRTVGREHFDNFVEYERLYGAEDHGPKRSYAPLVRRQSRVKTLLRRAISPIVDVRDKVRAVRDRIAAREGAD
jgi:hypothetical protein